MDFSSEGDPFASSGDAASDIVAPAATHASAASHESAPAPASEDPFASLESELTRATAHAGGQHRPAAAAASVAGNPYAIPEPQVGNEFADSVEPVVQYGEGAPEFEGAGEGASPYEDDEYEYDYEDEPRSRRGMVVVGALLGLVVVGGAAAYGFKSFMGGGDDSVPLVQASNDPVKTAPEQSADPSSGQQGKLVYDRISGNGDDAANSQVVSREEQLAVGADGRAIRVISGEGAPPIPSANTETDDSRRCARSPCAPTDRSKPLRRRRHPSPLRR